MATGQDIVTCDICKREPLQHFCNGCEIRLCNNCVVPHLGSMSLEGHTIVQYRYRDARNIQPKECLEHPTMIKTLYCRGCSDQICTRCIDKHREHDIIDLKQFVNSQYMLIEQSSEHLGTESYPNCTKCIEKTTLLLEEANKSFEQERQRILDAGEDLHCKLNEKVKILLNDIDMQKNETVAKLLDMKKRNEATMQDIDHKKDACEAAKSSLEDVLKFVFDESAFDLIHTAEVFFPRFETPANCTVNVGSLKRIKKEIRMLEEPFEIFQSLEEVNSHERPSTIYPVKDQTAIGNTLTLFELLDKEKDKDSEEYEEAYQDLVHMFTCQAVLRSTFPQANLLPQVTVNMSKPDEVPESVRERALYRYLVKLKPETYDGSYSDIWREYGTLLIAENLLDLARKANGPDRNIYLIVEKRQFYSMQTELQKKTEEVEELMTKLGRLTSL